VSWRILLEDLETAYGQALCGTAIDLGPRTTSFRDWAQRLAGFLGDGGLDHELDHWSSGTGAAELPVDHDEPVPGTPGGSVSFVLSEVDTEALLRAAPAAYRTRINDVLLGALAWALGRWAGHGEVTVDLEGHGREEILDGADLTRTVGWFTTIFPVTLTVPGTGEPRWRDLVKSVRRQLRAVPGNGFGYGALRYLGSPETSSRLAGRRAAQVSFNYLGQFDGATGDGDGLYRTSHAPIGRDHDLADRSAHLLEVVGSTQGGRLEFTWFYQPDMHDRSTVDAVAREFADALAEIARDCREVGR
jgi:non-ribosomal peptide synthase protein (TIGR01720 family)